MAMILRGKKGMFFTLIAILMVAVFLVAFSPKSPTTLNDRIPVIQNRVTVANDFVEVTKTAYLPAALRTSSYNALNALAQFEKAWGNRFADQAELTSNFAEVMLNGSIRCPSDGTHKDIETCVCELSNPPPACPNIDFMKNKNFTQRQRDIVNLSIATLQMWSNFTYYGYGVVLYQNNNTGPFMVAVNATVNFSVTNGIAWWNFTDEISVTLGFEGIQDPLYSVESVNDIGTLYTNSFNETNLTSWNLTNTYLEIEWRKYRYSPNGSSFLTRFTSEDVRSQCCGIESLINPAVMANIPAPDTGGSIEKAYSDWCFFGDRCPPNSPGSLFNISCISNNGGADNKFRGLALDADHIARYNLTDFVYTGTDPLAAQCNDLMQAVCKLDADITCN